MDQDSAARRSRKAWRSAGERERKWTGAAEAKGSKLREVVWGGELVPAGVLGALAGGVAGDFGVGVGGAGAVGGGGGEGRGEGGGEEGGGDFFHGVFPGCGVMGSGHGRKYSKEGGRVKREK